jgi:spermidine synthase
LRLVSDAPQVNAVNSDVQPAERATARRLVALTFMMLFVELALIRWLGAHVLYLAYFSNVVLLGSFLGIGLGFLTARRLGVPLLPFFPVVLAAIIGFVIAVPIKVSAVGGGALFFGAELESSGPPRELVLPLVFVAVACIFTCIGDGVAREFERLQNLDAYGWDILGSLAGVVAFTVAVFLGAPPVVWALVALVVTVWVIWPNPQRLVLAVVPMLVVTAIMADETLDDTRVWTPYYSAEIFGDASTGVAAFVNGVPHWFQTGDTDWDVYTTVYERIADADAGRVLIIGAGSGNDVAVSLAKGAASIDAVEIDPTLLDIARDNHPNRPYDDPRVTTHVADGRAFLEQTDETWDLILLALPDSITLLQGQSAVRLESYLFTSEAADAYRKHLAPGGVFAMYNLYRDQWLVDRYALTLQDSFDRSPCVSSVDDQEFLAVLAVSADDSAVACPTADEWTRSAVAPKPASDNHPFPYLKERTIPSFYLVSIAAILLISLGMVRLAGGPLRQMRGHLDLFLMGAAFLLLETKNVVQFALLFGTTWLVNALVFSGVLVSILVAVLVSKRVTLQRLWPVAAVLAGFLVIGYLVPQSSLLQLPSALRLVIASLIAFVPIFAANVLFAQKFRGREDGTTAFAANLIGAMVGGTLEYLALIVGFRNLLIVVALLYLGAFWAASRRTALGLSAV